MAARNGSARPSTLDDPISASLEAGERERYCYPQVRVIQPGGPYFKWPWEKVYKAPIATQIMNMAYDPEDPAANNQGAFLEAVTKDQLNTGLKGQIRYRVSEKNLYAFLFGVKRPIVHVMGYFISVLRERIANFEAPVAAASNQPGAPPVIGISINDLRKNLPDINGHMDSECASSGARYGMTLDASLITGIDPPVEVESALAAINTAYNQVSSDISLAQADGRSEAGAIPSRGGNRNAQGAGGGRTAHSGGGAIAGIEEKRSGGAGRLYSQRAAEIVQPGAARDFGGLP